MKIVPCIFVPSVEKLQQICRRGRNLDSNHAAAGVCGDYSHQPHTARTRIVAFQKTSARHIQIGFQRDKRLSDRPGKAGRPAAAFAKIPMRPWAHEMEEWPDEKVRGA